MNRGEELTEVMNVAEIEERIGYHFKDSQLLQRALTHSSYANESKTKIENNERMEFLGDSILSLVVSDYIYHRYHLREGDLTRIRASIVCEKALFCFAQEISLGESILLGRGEELMGGRSRPSIVSDAFEAVIAAIYLDGGLEPVREFVLRFAKEHLDAESPLTTEDYKTLLQEVTQKNPEERVTYVVVKEEGPDHDKHFEVEVRLNSNVIGRGNARSKKSAEQLAAKEALALMGK